MKKWFHLITTLLICILLGSTTQAGYCALLGRYNSNYVYVDLNGDGVEDVVSVSIDRSTLYVNYKAVKKLEYLEDVVVADLYKDKYIDIVTYNPKATVITVYRYNGKSFKKYTKYTGIGVDNNYRYSTKGKKVLKRLGYLVGANGNGKVNCLVYAKIPGSSQVLSGVPIGCNTAFTAQYKITKNSVSMVQKEYKLDTKTKTRATKQWYAYKKPQATGQNKLVGTIKKGTRCTAKKIKITSKYTYINFSFGSGKSGWVIFPTSQMVFM